MLFIVALIREVLPSMTIARPICSIMLFRLTDGGLMKMELIIGSVVTAGGHIGVYYTHTLPL